MSKQTKKTYQVPVVVEKDEDGYFVFCPSIDGCHTQGDTYEEAMENIVEVIELCLEEDQDARQDLPDLNAITFSSVSVTI